MDQSLVRGLRDRLYEKRKLAAIDLEKLIRQCKASDDSAKIRLIIEQLCQEFAFGPSRQNASALGGLIGLAAVAIALSHDVAAYLDDIIPPVLGCFSDQDSRLRYYALESMYNIAKVAKGEILLYFNEVFDALCKLAADQEVSVKNGAELLDRLIKDIVAEKASNYVSVAHPHRLSADQEPESSAGRSPTDGDASYDDLGAPAFSLPKFIPLLAERIYTLNPFTRMFLVNWISVLDSIPDLELISYLPAFLKGLMQYLADNNEDVRIATQQTMNGFLQDIRRTTDIKKVLKDRRRLSQAIDESDSASANSRVPEGPDGRISPIGLTERLPEDNFDETDDWVPGQDVRIDYAEIINILIPFLRERDEYGLLQITALRWIEAFFSICPDELLPFTPKLLEKILPALAPVYPHHQAARAGNERLTNLILSVPSTPATHPPGKPTGVTPRIGSISGASVTSTDGGDSASVSKETQNEHPNDPFDYYATVNSLTLQFLNEHEETRVAAFDWLIMLHKKAPNKILTIDDGTFPLLLKTLSDPSEKVVTRDLQLLAQVSSNSDDSYFSSFMVNLLSLFGTDRKLLETRGSLIIRQLCVNLNPDRIYRSLAEILERDEDLEFASIMVQNLHNNLVIAPELGDMRRRLKNLDTKDGQALFVSLYNSWCHNAVATFSLCLLAQAYEHASNLLQSFGDLEITVQFLIQVDKLVQIIESPVFTYLRLQLLEPEKYPYLFKCLYGLLMLLPQSSAFATLRNRLNSISPIGYLHLFPRPAPESTTSRPDRRPSRPKSEEIKWTDLLEKFRSVQLRHEKARTRQLLLPRSPHIDTAPSTPAVGAAKRNVSVAREAPVTAPAAASTHKKGSRSIHTITQGIMNVGRGGSGAADAKKSSVAQGKRG